MKTYTVHLWHLADLFLEWEMFRAETVEIIKKIFYIQ